MATYLLAETDYDVWFVNPSVTEILGRPVYPSLADLPGRPDLVDVFRRPADLPEVADEAIAAGASTLWLQLGLSDDAVAEQAERRRPERGDGPLPQDRARPVPRRSAPRRLRHRRAVVSSPPVHLTAGQASARASDSSIDLHGSQRVRKHRGHLG